MQMLIVAACRPAVLSWLIMGFSLAFLVPAAWSCSATSTGRRPMCGCWASPWAPAPCSGR
jgi:hypothetical protein